MARPYDYDWLVIGSGFGGSVVALRLTEKGYSVGVLECGRRFADDEFATSTWDVRRYYWMPKLGMKGVLRLTLFKDVFVASGCGVGGGSLGYANTLYVPPSDFFKDPQWSELEDWESALAPHYAQAQRMLGVVDYDRDDQPGMLLKHLGEALGVRETYRRTRVGVFLGGAGETVADPFFGGEGPDRTGCLRCGRCMVGCPHGAKNTLVKNYLWFAERRGAQVMPERTVIDIRPLGAADGSDGYAVTSERSGAWFRTDRQTQTARGVIVAAGALGTNQLLQRCRLRGSLPAISPRLGELVRTNSEAIVVVTANRGDADFSEGIAIGASIYPDPHTHIETVTYGRAGDSMKLLYTLLTGDGTRVTRPLRWLAGIARHPLKVARTLSPVGWSRRSITLLVMQTLDNAISLRAQPRRFGGGVSLRTEQDADRPNPTFIPIANQAAEMLAKQINGIAQSNVSEALANIPTTAHILGGAVIAADRDHGVIDRHQQVFGYQNLLVCDGAAIPANVGVNPSLTITALAEHAINQIPAADSRHEAQRTKEVAADVTPTSRVA
jgi:cholesterol oxidase